MSENPAAKIKITAKIITWIILITAIVGGFRLIFKEFTWLGWITIMVGGIIATIIDLHFTGLAELVANSSDIKSKICDTKERDTTVLDRFVAPAAPQPAEPQVKTNAAPKNSNSQSGPVKPVPSDSPGMVICPKCGCEQKASRTACWKCSVKFLK